MIFRRNNADWGALLTSVSCPVRLEPVTRLRERLRDFVAGDFCDKKFLVICAYQRHESLSQLEQFSGQLAGVFLKLASDRAIFRRNNHSTPPEQERPAVLAV
jgi:hypothetical protein